MKAIYYASVTSKGQITVPKAVRETLAVYPGDKVAFTVDNGTVAVEGINTDIEDLIGSIKPLTGRDPGDFDDLIEEAWSAAALERWRRVNEQ